MKSIGLSAALAAASLAGSYGIASAQSFGIYVGPGYSSYYDEPDYRYVERSPGVRYYSAPRYEEDVVRAPRRSGGCGTYYYWDGEQCVDARYKRRD
jgi:hypothetical protein